MEEKDSQGGKGRFWRKALLTLPLWIIALVVVVLALAAIGFPLIYWLSANTVNNIVNNPNQTLDVAVAVLTVLVAIVAIYASWTSITIKTNWEDFQKAQEKKTKDELEEVKTDWNNWRGKQEPIIERQEKETNELNRLKNLGIEVGEDPHLNSEDAKKWMLEIKEHYFTIDRKNDALKYYGVARWYENEKQYSDAIKYHEKADDVDLEDNIESNKLRKHIWQSLGVAHSLRGQKRGANGKKAAAIKDYNNAIEYYEKVIENDPQFVEAFDNKGNTYIELAKISSDNEKKRLEYIDNAIKCYDDAIKKRVERARQWWATFHFDKARALALRAGKDKREDLDKVAKELEKTLDLFVAKPVGFFDIPDQFQDFENVKKDNEIKRLLDLLRGVIRQAMQKGD